MNIRLFFYSIMAGRRKGIFSFLFKALFIIPSFIYSAGFGIIKVLYKTGVLKAYKAASKIISIGNITLGGTGKTPFVEMLAADISSANRKTAILLRGYGNDETDVLKENLPSDMHVLVGKDRIKNIKENKSVGIFILDDGFQHIKLHRDLDIVLIDSTCPFGDGLLLPAGILREPIGDLKRADIVVLTKTDLGKDNLDGIREKIRKINPSLPIFESVHRPLYFIETTENQRIELDTLRGKEVCLISGIADNESFYKTIQLLGVEIKEKFFFDDHYQYTPLDLHSIARACEAKSLQTVITSQKDYVRIKKAFGLRSSVFNRNVKMLVLHIKLEIKDEQRQELKRRISSVYSG